MCLLQHHIFVVLSSLGWIFRVFTLLHTWAFWAPSISFSKLAEGIRYSMKPTLFNPSLYTRGADEVSKGFDLVGIVLVLVWQSSQTRPETAETLSFDDTAGNP